MLDAVSDGVLVVDCDRVITFFNRSAEHITGFSATEVVGRRCSEVLRGSRCRGRCVLDEVLKTGQSVTGVELTILNRRNRDVPIGLSAAVLRNIQGDIVGGFETFRALPTDKDSGRNARGLHTLADIISRNHRMTRVLELVPDVAASSAAVLIQGETGTGKELLARAIHHASPRRDGPFVMAACSAVPDARLESDLFGHVAGAFPGARADRKGRLESAAGGTIFLDEIADTSPAMQVKLLRLLQDGTFEPMGSGETHTHDARIVAATRHDLKGLAAAGRFREDLYYRINTVCLTLPALRERREDIPLLAERFMERFIATTGKSVRNVSADGMHALMTYTWPGNVRELEQAIEHAFVLVKDVTIHIEHLPDEVARAATARRLPRAVDGRSILAASERQAIETVLDRFSGNKVATSRELGISRSTLWRKMRKLGIASAPSH